MGAADVVPGVSGGTIAFITGIYNELIQSLRAIDREAFALLRLARWHDLWKKINGPFLATLIAGICTSLLTIGHLMSYLLKHYPIYVRSLFFGLILISSPLVLREIKTWNVSTVVVLCIGIGLAYLLTRTAPITTPDALVLVFIGGMLSICAMITPGISGTFILMLIGQYHNMITALHNYTWPVIFVFSLGCLSGIWLSARFIGASLDKYHSATVALLACLMLGSLNKIWPWREVLEFVTDSNGQQIPVFDKSILPWHYLATTGKDPQIFQAIVMMTLGVFIVVLVEKIAVRLKTKI